MRLLLTGSAGYVGAVARVVFEAAGHDVVGLDTALYEGCDLAPLRRRPLPRSASTSVTCGEERPRRLRRRCPPRRALERPDRRARRDPDVRDQPPSDASASPSSRAPGACERFVFASSCSMYGASRLRASVDETAPARARSPRTRSRRCASEQSLAAARERRLLARLLRFATAYGVSPRLRLDIVLNNLVGWAVTTGAVRLQSDGTAWRPLIHVEDMARACAAVLEAPRERIHGEAFNAGCLRRELPRARPRGDRRRRRRRRRGEFAEGAGTDPRSYRVDFSKIAETLDGVPAASGMRDGSSASSSRPTVRPRWTRRCSPATGSRGSRGSARCSPKVGSTASCAGRTPVAAGADGAAGMIFTETRASGRLRHRPRAPGGRPRVLRARVLPARVRRSRAEARDRPGERRLQQRGRHAARDALPVSAGGGDEDRALHARRDPRHHRRPPAREPDLPPSTSRCGSSEDNGRALYVPERFAHGYQTLVDGRRRATRSASSTRPTPRAGSPYDDPRLGLELAAARVA